MWTDCHAHLSDLSSTELAACIEEAQSFGVAGILNTAVSLPSCGAVLRQCGEYPEMLGAVVGISPFDTRELPDNWREELASLLAGPAVRGLGETGLDTTNPSYPPLALQQPVFESQLELALEYGLPVVLHSRGAERRAVEICVNAGVSTAVFHCFTGDEPSLKYVLDQGFHVSFSGIVTFKNSAVADLVPLVPVEQLLIETDAPYLAPTPHRGERNRPGWVSLVGKRIADLRGTPPDQLAAELDKNVRRVFSTSTTPPPVSA